MSDLEKIQQFLEPIDSITSAIKTLQKKVLSHKTMIEMLMRLPPKDTLVHGLVERASDIYLMESAITVTAENLSKSIRKATTELTDLLTNIAEEAKKEEAAVAETETHADQQPH